MFLKAEEITGRHRDWPSDEFFVHHSNATRKQFADLRKLVHNNSGEKALDKYIQKNPNVLSMALKYAHTGHHGGWVIPQQIIKPKISTSNNGLIPDYIIGGKSSDGFDWWVVELKGANASIFSRTKGKLRFSHTLNEAICQLMEYIDYCSEIQATLRDQFRLKGFREPHGLILIGREQELDADPQKQKLRAYWNRINGARLEIRTFDSLIRTFQTTLQMNGNL